MQRAGTQVVAATSGTDIAAQALSVPLSVVLNGKSLAFAAYNEATNQIILEEFIAGGDDMYEMVDRVIAAIRPTLLLVSSKLCSNDALLRALRTPPPNPSDGLAATGDGTNDVHTATPHSTTPYKLLKTSTFDVKKCRTIILKLRVRSLMRQGQNTDRSMHDSSRRFPTQDEYTFKMSSYHALATVIDFNDVAQVMAVGSLLSFIHTNTFRSENLGCVVVNDIVRANASTRMTLSEDTLSALHIFATEHHPLAAAKGSGISKEGYSLFSFLDRTKTQAGRSLLRDWMLRPLTDVAAIRYRQDGIELLLLPDMRGIWERMFSLLERVGQVDKIIVRMQKCCAQYSDFLSLSKSLSSAVTIIDGLQEDILSSLHNRMRSSEAQDDAADENMLGEEVSSLDRPVDRYISFISSLLQRCNVELLQQLHERITSVVDEGLTASVKSVAIRSRYDERLDAMKVQYDNLADILNPVADGLKQAMPHIANFMNVVFMPQVGFLIQLRGDIDWSQPDILTNDFTFVCSDAGISYFKNASVRELDWTFGDLDAKIKDTEALIVVGLEEDILQYEAELRCTFEALAELDCIQSLADVASAYNYVRPEIDCSAGNCIHILNGRHPLQELAMESEFVPNNTDMNVSKRVNVVTGPNFSGKSCYARQVGLLVVMAQMGSFIPCGAARISIVRQLFTLFPSVETCSIPQSSFQLDLTKMGSILRRVTPSSLVIIDEFGKGTSPASGIALLTAALKQFSKSTCNVICTSHFVEAFTMGLLTDGDNGIKALRMAVQLPATFEAAAVPLFFLEDGVTSSSAGLACAKMAGVKDAVIERAREVVNAMKNNRQIQPLAEILRGNLDLSELAKSTLLQFKEADWTTTNDSDLDRFLTHISMM